MSSKANRSITCSQSATTLTKAVLCFRATLSAFIRRLKTRRLFKAPKRRVWRSFAACGMKFGITSEPSRPEPCPATGMFHLQLLLHPSEQVHGEKKNQEAAVAVFAFSPK